MPFETILVKEEPRSITITLNRLERKNSINQTLLHEISQVIDHAEQIETCRAVILEGQNGLFCTGMDFNEAANGGNLLDDQYMTLIKRFTLMPKVVIAKLDGSVMAGGMGIVAACDLVVSTPRSTFSLPEALWGLLPANVLPFLIRRVGFQKAYVLTLTTSTIQATEAKSINLVDELSENIDEAIRKLMLRLVRLEDQTILDMKDYFRKMWLINEAMEQTAIQELARLINEPRIINNIKNFVDHHKFPWEK